MNFYLEKIKTKIENKKVEKTSENEKTQNKIIFIHFGGSSLVVILYDCDAGKIIKKKEKLIGGIDIDIKLTKDSLTKFKNDSNGIKIMDITLIYKVKNLIEEEKKNLYSNNKEKIEIKIDRFKYSFSLKYEISKENLIIGIENIIDDFNKILKDVLENENKDEIKNVIYTGNNFKFKIFEHILYDYFPENICEHIFDEELKL
jgi:molecular chaperone DnaK (HSP70)